MWMYTLLPKILNMSLTAGIVTVLVLISRIMLKRMPKIFSYALWAVVLFRLVCPVSLPSEFSLVGLFHSPASTANGGAYSSITYIPDNIVHSEYPQVDLPIPIISEVINDNLPQGEEQLAADPLEGWMALATLLWLLGIAGMLAYSAVSLILLRRKLIGAVRLRDNIYLADHIVTPFVIGVFRTKIYLPSTLPEEERGFVILHEETHIRRFDHIIKMLAFLALSVHWFNPLVWVAFICCVKDMEMSCDERVLKEMGGGIKAAYSTSLLSLATGRRIINGSPLAFGEGNIKGRIKNVMNFKKPAAWVVAIAVMLVAALSIGFATNRSSSGADDNSTRTSEVTAARVTLYSYNTDAAKPLGDPLLQDGRESGYQIPDTVAMEIFYPADTVKLFLYCRSITGNPILLRSVDFTITNSSKTNIPDIRNPDVFVWNVAADFPNGFNGTIWAEAVNTDGEKLPSEVCKARNKPGSEIDNVVYSTEYGRVKITFLSENVGFKPVNEFEITDSKIAAHIDSALKTSLTAAQGIDLNNNHTNQYTIKLSNEIGGYSCVLYYDTLYDKAYIINNGGLYETGTDFARYIDSFLENTNSTFHIDDADAAALFQTYGWTLDYRISAMNNKLNNISALTGFNPNAYYFAYNNELSKDIGMDMSGYSNSADIYVEIYRIYESMPQEFYPIQNGRGIVVKNGGKIIGAFISAGRHSTFNSCSLKGNSFDKVTGQTLNEWLAEMVQADGTDERLSKSQPEQVIGEYFTALNQKDAETAKYCMSKKTLLGQLTSNMPNGELFNEGIGLPLTNPGVGAPSNFDNLKSIKLLKVEPIDEPDNSTKIFRVTMNLQYNEEGIISSGEQFWDCRMVYGSPQTGWKIEGLGH